MRNISNMAARLGILFLVFQAFWILPFSEGQSLNIRLVGGSNPLEGRVEVFASGEWGTVCDDLWDLPDANVVCQSLGLGDAVASVSSAGFGPGTGSILLDDVMCSGSEASIFDCGNDGIGIHNCVHNEDAGVRCAGTSFSIRLTGTGSTFFEGRVEIYYDGEWGTICGHSFYSQAATVVCRQLGLGTQNGYYRSGAQYGEGTGPVWLRVSGCTGNEEAIQDCKDNSYDWGDTSCSSSYSHVDVRCNPTSYELQYSVRLTGPEYTPSEGRVEINYGGRWGTICGDLWDNNDAAVVCKQLGFTGPSTANVGVFGRGSGLIWLDNVGCSTSDDILASCWHSAWGSHNCDHSQDAGVVCSAINNFDENSIRLAGTGNSVFEGRVEIFHAGQWGTVCDWSFGSNDAAVVCRQLGFGGTATYLTGSYYGAGSGVVWLQNPACTGSEVLLADCNHQGWGIVASYCAHDRDVGVRCSASPTSTQSYSVRLANNGSSPTEGRVEINIQGAWGTVCGDLWDNDDAAVVCYQLGFTGPSTANVGAYAQGNGPIWMDDVMCSELHTSLAQCSHRGWGVHNCDHRRDAGVICSIDDNVDDFSVRLSGIGSSFHEGRVEIFFNSRWGTVCNNSFDSNAARVVCRQLGFKGANSYRTRAYYGTGSGVVWLDGIRCNGEENNLALCTHNTFGDTNCHHTEDVGVSCDAAGGITKETNLRLVGPSNSEGRLEINHNGQWGTICDIGWDLADATIGCRQLGFSGALQAAGGAHFGKGTGTVWMRDVACGGNEFKLASCSHSGWGNTDGCTHTNDAGVVCNTESEHDDYTVRLAGAGSLSNAGRVEIYYNSQWGTTCDNLWDIRDATVVCRRLGFANATAAPRGARYGEGSGPVWIDGVACSGTETSLELCGHDGFGGIDCDHSKDASVICSLNRNEQDFVVRLAGAGSSESEGRVEISFDGQWGTVCSDRWDLDDATVVCQQLGFIGAQEIGDVSTYGEGTGPIWLDSVGCSGTETTLNECVHNGWGISDCAHSHDAWVVCRKTATIFSGLGSGGAAGISVGFGVLAVIIIVLIVVIIKLLKRLDKMKRQTATMNMSTVSNRVVNEQDTYENLTLPNAYEGKQ